MSDHFLDFKFGWRWLMPLQNCTTIGLCGFEPDEARFWRQSFATKQVSDDFFAADALVIDADRCSNATLSRAIQASPSVLCVVGSRKRLRKWREITSVYRDVRQYGLLPATRPRVVVPLNCRRHTSYALALHRPGRWLARLAVQAAGFLAHFGSTGLLRGRSLLIATTASLPPNGVASRSEPIADLDTANTDYALYLGVEGENRKTVALPLGTAAPSIIIKTATSTQSMASLRNEAAALESLQHTALAQNVPHLLAIDDDGATVSIYQEFRSRTSATPWRQRIAVTEFLGQLSRINRQNRPLADLLGEMRDKISSPTLRADARKMTEDAWARLESLAGSGTVVWEHRIHGDFAPWNCVFTRQGLFVFDWEESKECDLAFGDLLYFICAPILHMGRKHDADHALNDIFRIGNSIARTALPTPVELELYLTCWLLRKMDESPFYYQMLQALMRRWTHTKG